MIHTNRLKERDIQTDLKERDIQTERDKLTNWQKKTNKKHINRLARFPGPTMNIESTNFWPDIWSHDPGSDPCPTVRQEAERKIVFQFGEAMTKKVFPKSGNNNSQNVTGVLFSRWFQSSDFPKHLQNMLKTRLVMGKFHWQEGWLGIAFKIQLLRFSANKRTHVAKWDSSDGRAGDL